jgi:hypothetical protein
MASRFWSFSSYAQRKNLLINYHEFEKPSKVGLGDSRTVEAVGVGNVCEHVF